MFINEILVSAEHLTFLIYPIRWNYHGFKNNTVAPSMLFVTLFTTKPLQRPNFCKANMNLCFNILNSHNSAHLYNLQMAISACNMLSVNCVLLLDFFDPLPDPVHDSYPTVPRLFKNMQSYWPNADFWPPMQLVVFCQLLKHKSHMESHTILYHHRLAGHLCDR